MRGANRRPPAVPFARALRVTLSLCLGCFASLVAAQVEEAPLPAWFPAAALDDVSEQLAQGIAAIQPEASAEQIADAGRRGVLDLVATVDRWGFEGLRERAPSFSELATPSLTDPTLALVATFGVCSLGVYEELASSPREKFYVKLVEVSVAVVSAYLRAEALAAGATDESMQAALTTPEWRDLSQRLVEDESARSHVNRQCGPVMSSLLE